MKATHHLFLSVFVDDNMENAEAVSKYRQILETLKKLMPVKNIVEHRCFKTSCYTSGEIKDEFKVDLNTLIFSAGIRIQESEIQQLRRNFSFGLSAIFHAAAIDQLSVTPAPNKGE